MGAMLRENCTKSAAKTLKIVLTRTNMDLRKTNHELKKTKPALRKFYPDLPLQFCAETKTIPRGLEIVSARK